MAVARKTEPQELTFLLQREGYTWKKERLSHIEYLSLSFVPLIHVWEEVISNRKNYVWQALNSWSCVYLFHLKLPTNNTAQSFLLVLRAIPLFQMCFSWLFARGWFYAMCWLVFCYFILMDLFWLVGHALISKENDSSNTLREKKNEISNWFGPWY